MRGGGRALRQPCRTATRGLALTCAPRSGRAAPAAEPHLVTKRQPKGPRTEGFTLENVKMETITAIPYGEGAREGQEGGDGAQQPLLGRPSMCASCVARCAGREVAKAWRGSCCRLVPLGLPCIFSSHAAWW